MNELYPSLKFVLFDYSQIFQTENIEMIFHIAKYYLIAIKCYKNNNYQFLTFLLIPFLMKINILVSTKEK